MQKISSELQQFLADLEGEAAFNDKPISCNTRSRVGDTPLHIAAIRGTLDIAYHLLDLGVDIDATGENGYTALHYAVAHERVDMVQFLVDQGCDVSIRIFDGDGDTAGDLVSYCENGDVKLQIKAILDK
ncbi:ankyrin repeat domain-containing protein [Verrucomicrobiaceae bacterium N1E253]|uniref:Ankyrin repeat domain-containing protein n=1 Tax=Oceaniferula marina TaxID=2748318 RepID=A0A851GKX9_9BACT|nr:ankyrin repeat domain-containing protein [Oceaniferula marina]NWK57789.1 ankyrin repeat domain-containing protein [Oceaniferula marina]